MKAKNQPTGEGRIYTKDIDYTTCGQRVKDYGVKACTLPSTSGMEAVTKTSAPDRPYSTK